MNPTHPTTCPCCSGKPYIGCCAPLINGNKRALTPEALLRSRYTAYTQANIDYIEKTMRGSAAKTFDKQEAEAWARSLQWEKLEVIDAPAVKPGKTRGLVKFTAHYKTKNNPQTLEETSEFRLKKGRWYYTNSKD